MRYQGDGEDGRFDNARDNARHIRKGGRGRSQEEELPNGRKPKKSFPRGGPGDVFGSGPLNTNEQTPSIPTSEPSPDQIPQNHNHDKVVPGKTTTEPVATTAPQQQQTAGHTDRGRNERQPGTFRSNTEKRGAPLRVDGIRPNREQDKELQKTKNSLRTTLNALASRLSTSIQMLNDNTPEEIDETFNHVSNEILGEIKGLLHVLNTNSTREDIQTVQKKVDALKSDIEDIYTKTSLLVGSPMLRKAAARVIERVSILETLSGLSDITIPDHEELQGKVDRIAHYIESPLEETAPRIVALFVEEVENTLSSLERAAIAQIFVTLNTAITGITSSYQKGEIKEDTYKEAIARGKNIESILGEYPLNGEKLLSNLTPLLELREKITPKDIATIKDRVASLEPGQINNKEKEKLEILQALLPLSRKFYTLSTTYTSLLPHLREGDKLDGLQEQLTSLLAQLDKEPDHQTLVAFKEHLEEFDSRMTTLKKRLEKGESEDVSGDKKIATPPADVLQKSTSVTAEEKAALRNTPPQDEPSQTTRDSAPQTQDPSTVAKQPKEQDLPTKEVPTFVEGEPKTPQQGGDAASDVTATPNKTAAQPPQEQIVQKQVRETSSLFASLIPQIQSTLPVLTKESQATLRRQLEECFTLRSSVTQKGAKEEHLVASYEKAVQELRSLLSSLSEEIKNSKELKKENAETSPVAPQNPNTSSKKAVLRPKEGNAARVETKDPTLIYKQALQANPYRHLATQKRETEAMFSQLSGDSFYNKGAEVRKSLKLSDAYFDKYKKSPQEFEATYIERRGEYTEEQKEAINEALIRFIQDLSERSKLFIHEKKEIEEEKNGTKELIPQAQLKIEGFNKKIKELSAEILRLAKKLPLEKQKYIAAELVIAKEEVKELIQENPATPASSVPVTEEASSNSTLTQADATPNKEHQAPEATTITKSQEGVQGVAQEKPQEVPTVESEQKPKSPETLKTMREKVEKLLNTRLTRITSTIKERGAVLRALAFAVITGSSALGVKTYQDITKTKQEQTKTIAGLTSWRDLAQGPLIKDFQKDLLDNNLSFAEIIKKHAPGINLNPNNPSEMSAIESIDVDKLLKDQNYLQHLSKEQRNELCSIVILAQTIAQNVDADKVTKPGFVPNKFYFTSPLMTLRDFVAGAKEVGTKKDLEEEKLKKV